MQLIIRDLIYRSPLMYVIDVKNINKGWTFFLVFGMNPLFLYVLSEVVAIIFSQWEIKDAIYQTTKYIKRTNLS